MMFRHSRSPPIHILSLCILLITGATLQVVHSSPLTSPSGLSDDTIACVRGNMLQIANASWELGTAAEALTELEWPSLSVFNKSAFPPPTMLDSSFNASDVLGIAFQTVSVKPFTSMALVAGDDATGDPASIGNAVLLANWTRPNLDDTTYSFAAGQQLSYLVNYAPRTPEGAISQRGDQVQLWADFVYMAPPFIAYFGILQGGEAELPLLQAAYDQCRLYRDQLLDADVGLWRHVALGDWQDINHWATGNGWAAGGMLRVAQTMNHSIYADQLVEQSVNLTNWVNEILGGVWTYQQPNGALLNWVDDSTSFGDSSSTALIASITYRMAVLTKDTRYIPNANAALSCVQENIDENGWLTNTVDPYTFNTPIDASTGAHSPEGQAFVLLMHSAWRDWVSATGANVSKL